VVLANLGRLVGAVPEMAPSHEGGALRAVLREVGSNPELAMGAATHRLDALVSRDWFEAFGVRGIPTVELCVGGLFQLARRGPSAATFTVVSLDDEPAFEGAGLAALLTNDSGMAQRVRDLFLSGQGSIEGTSDCLFDATPRGLADDEPALLALIERAIARETADWAAAKSAPDKAAGSVFSLVWNRIFQSEAAEAAPAVPQEPDPIPAAPRGKNPWLARLAEMEREHREAIGALTETIDSARCQGLERYEQAQAELGEWKGRFEKAEGEAASVALELGERISLLEGEQAALRTERDAALDQARQAEGSSREALGRAEENARAAQHESAVALTRLEASVTEWRVRFDTANQTANEESQRLEASHMAMLNRFADEADRLRAESQAEAQVRRREAQSLVERLAVLESEKTMAFGQRAELEGRLLQLESDHSGALRLADERAALERRQDLETISMLNASLVALQSGLEAATEASGKEHRHLETRHAAQVQHLRDEWTQALETAEATAKQHARGVATLAERIEGFEREAATSEGRPGAGSFAWEREDRSLVLMPEATRASLPGPEVTPNPSGRHALPDFAPWEYERLLSRARKRTGLQTWVHVVARRLRGH
jgi:hypothetical protein